MALGQPCPQKEVSPMFRKLIDPDNPLMTAMSLFTDCVFLSLFWLVCAFPVVTGGASAAALYDGVYRAFRKRDKHSWTRFFITFKDSLKSALLPTAVYLAVFLGGGWLLIRLWNGAVAGSLPWMGFSGAAVAGVVLLGILTVLFPTLSRFENSFGALLKNTLLLSLAHLPRTLCLGVVSGGAIYLCSRFVLPLFFLPALAALVKSFLLEPMFRPYMPEEPPEEGQESS